MNELNKETGKSPITPETSRRTALERYLEIIKHPGKGLPKNSETPKDFLLPEDIIQPMLYTFDLSQLDGKERSQRLY